jgi:hypothetical protein
VIVAIPYLIGSHALQFRALHKTLRVTPAMQAGLADHVWSLEEIAGLLDALEKQFRRLASTNE